MPPGGGGGGGGAGPRGGGGAKFCGDLMELCATSDVVVVCVALTPETKGLIGRPHFKAMKKGACACMRACACV